MEEAGIIPSNRCEGAAPRARQSVPAAPALICLLQRYSTPAEINSMKPDKLALAYRKLN